jgi:putative membrane protein
MVLQSLAGLPAFLAYFCLSAVAVVGYLLAYSFLTHHDEFKLIAQNKPSAAIALGMSLLGFALPLASAVAHSNNIVDCAIWAVIAFLVQILVYWGAQIPMPDLSQRIEKGEVASGLWLGLASITAGLLSAACMTW